MAAFAPSPFLNRPQVKRPEAMTASQILQFMLAMTPATECQGAVPRVLLLRVQDYYAELINAIWENA